MRLYQIITTTHRGIKMSFDYKRMIKFEHNVGEKEKKYRLYGGAALVVISIFMGSVWALLIGAILIATGFWGWCPAYSGFGKNTCETAGGTPGH